MNMDAVEQKNQIIEYLKKKYENDTGRKVVLPMEWNDFLGSDDVFHKEEVIKSFETYSQPVAEEEKKIYKNFSEAVYGLNLPKNPSLKKGAKATDRKIPQKGAPVTTRGKKLGLKPNELIETIDISGFYHTKISRAAMRELIDGLINLPCIRTLILRNNGFTDEYTDDILEILGISKIKYLDLSYNHFGKAGGRAIAAKLKDEVSHLHWIDLTQNDFEKDNAVMHLLAMGLKNQTHLMHAAVSCYDTNSDAVCKLPQSCRALRSLNLCGSILSISAMGILYNMLTLPQFYITALSLKHCFLSSDHVYMLAKAIRLNKTLVKLDLSCNGMKNSACNSILQALKDNMYLTQLDLHHNMLSDVFADNLADCLSHNNILHTVNISRNPVGKAGGEAILSAIMSNNETLASLGDLSLNYDMGVRIREEIRQCLTINNANKQSKQLLISTRKQNKANIKDINLHDKETAEHGANVYKELEYPLLKPVEFTNPIEYGEKEFYVWNLG